MMENVPRLFEVGDPDNLDFWVPRFINEVGRADGDPYPPRTIHQLLAGLQRSMLDHNNCLTKFLDRTNPVFRPIHGACDSVYHSLHCAGIGTSVCHTAIISEEEEAKLWEKGILGVDNSKSLQRAVFYFSKLLMTNNTSPSVEADVSSRDKLSTGCLGGINGCSIGTMTVNFSGSF